MQLSLLRSQDARQHLALGAALAPLRAEGVLLVGSGVSFHNFKYFFGDQQAGRRLSRTWDEWLRQAMTAPMGAAARTDALAGWVSAPAAREAHPKGAAEHLMPAFVVAGAGMAGRGGGDGGGSGSGGSGGVDGGRSSEGEGAAVVVEGDGTCGEGSGMATMLNGFAFSQFEFR